MKGWKIHSDIGWSEDFKTFLSIIVSIFTIAVIPAFAWFLKNMHNENTKRLDVLDQQDVSFNESLSEINREIIRIGTKAVPRADIENALARMREGLASELNDLRMRVSRLEELNFRRFGRGNIDSNGDC